MSPRKSKATKALTVEPSVEQEVSLQDPTTDSSLHAKLVASLDEALSCVEALRQERILLKRSTSRLQSLHRELQELRKVADRYCK